MFITFIVFFIFWELAVKILHIEDWILPGPLQIIQALWSARHLIAFHSVSTVIEAVTGLLIAVVAGVGISIAMYWSVKLEKIIYPFLILSHL